VFAVAGAAECSSSFPGWYYDNPAAPSVIIGCPETCSFVQTAASTVEVVLGCASEPPPS
jgi:hypothetical protein